MKMFSVDGYRSKVTEWARGRGVLLREGHILGDFLSYSGCKGDT